MKWSNSDNQILNVGQLPINAQVMEEKGRQMLEEANQFLASIPPDKLIEVF